MIFDYFDKFLGFHKDYKMCVDDYSFRHYSARRDKVCRKFSFVDQQDFSKTYYVNISQFEQYGDVALCKILIYLSTKGLIIENKKFFLPKFNAIIQPYTFCKILFEALDEKQIILKMYPNDKSSEEIFQENQDVDSEIDYEQKQQQEYYDYRFQDLAAPGAIQMTNIIQQSLQSEQHSKPRTAEIEEENTGDEKMVDQSDERNHQKNTEIHKKAKEAERGIGQVITAVKIWRALYQSKRCNLTNAAKVVRISKKSLDDYYLVLRIGQILGFDFGKNLQNRMGDLRNFIRAQQSKVTGKLGKKVKCFDLVQEIDLDKLMHQFQNREAGPQNDLQ